VRDLVLALSVAQIVGVVVGTVVVSALVWREILCT
jgi:glycerol uptake facilitator-like aquaporin